VSFEKDYSDSHRQESETICHVPPDSSCIVFDSLKIYPHGQNLLGMKKLMLSFSLAAFLSLSYLPAVPQAKTPDSTAAEESPLKEQLSDQEEARDRAVQDTPPAKRLNFSWNRGLHIDMPREHFKLKVGGRIQADAAWIFEDSVLQGSLGDLGSDAEIRSARLYVSGTVHPRIGFRAQYDFKFEEWKNLYLDITIPHVGTVRAGKQKETFGLELLTGLKQLTFIERALPNGLDPARNYGVRLSNAVFKERMTWAFGSFRETGRLSEGRSSNRNFSARLTGLPWYGDSGQQLLHLGFGYSLRYPSEDRVRVAQRPESHLAPLLVDTGIFAANKVTLINSEVAWVQRRLSLQGEYKKGFFKSEVTNDPRFSGAYVQFSVFLTGESRKYNPLTGTFELITPLHRFKDSNWGHGAWELAIRYSYIDLNDRGILGGEMKDVVLGLNWYMHSSTRVTLNYIHSYLKAGGSAKILMTRLQIAF